MIKTAISIAIVAVVLWVGWVIWQKWETYSTHQEEEQKQSEQAAVSSDSLPGMPTALEATYRAVAAKNDPATLKSWLRMYGQQVDDPRRASIELDYMVMISTSDPQEAKKIFADVKGRITEDSPLYARIKLLAKTYE